MKRIINRALGRVGLRLSRARTIPDLEAALQRERQLVAQCDIVPSVYGHRMHFDPLDRGISLTSLNEAPLSGGEARFIVATLRPGQTALDVGANIGLMTLLMARAVGPSGKVFAFEPGPRSFHILRNNIAANGYENVIAVNSVAGDRNTDTELQVCGTGESDNRAADVAADAKAYYRIRIKAIVLDDYLDGRRVDLAKIDVQGSEFKVLSGLRRTIAKNPAIQIIAEYGPGWLEAAGVSPNDYFALIEGMGLAMFDLPDEGPEAPVTREWLAANIGGDDRPQTNLVLRRAIPSIERP
jgi:FkbM family methyltransferase